MLLLVRRHGHVWYRCGSRLKDLADAEERSVIANSHPNDTAANVVMHWSLPDEYAMTFPMAVLCGREEGRRVSTTVQTQR